MRSWAMTQTRSFTTSWMGSGADTGCKGDEGEWRDESMEGHNYEAALDVLGKLEAVS